MSLEGFPAIVVILTTTRSIWLDRGTAHELQSELGCLVLDISAAGKGWLTYNLKASTQADDDPCIFGEARWSEGALGGGHGGISGASTMQHGDHMLVACLKY